MHSSKKKHIEVVYKILRTWKECQEKAYSSKGMGKNILKSLWMQIKQGL